MAEQDGVRIALCAGSGAEFLTLGRDGKLHKDAPGPSAPRETCPFALAASAASLPPELHLSQPAVELAQQSTTELAEIALAQRRYPRPPTTGPPALA